MSSKCKIEITEEMLEEAREATDVFTVETSSGDTLFGLSGLSDSFSYAAIDGVELELTDKESGDTTTYDCELLIRDSNSFKHYKITK